MKSEIIHSQLGRVILKTRKNARNFSYRIHQHYIEISGPLFTEHQMIDLLVKNYSQIQQHQSQTETNVQALISPQSTISCPEYSIKIIQKETIHANKIQLKRDDKLRILEILIASKAPYQSANYQAHLDKIITNQLLKLAQTFIIPQAKQIIETHNFPVTELKLSKAKRAWGKCNSNGVVSLSCYLMLVSTELRESVIYHEMAHLYHLNHSKAFYQLLMSWLPDYPNRKKQLNNIQSPLLYAHK